MEKNYLPKKISRIMVLFPISRPAQSFAYITKCARLELCASLELPLLGCTVKMMDLSIFLWADFTMKSLWHAI